MHMDVILERLETARTDRIAIPPLSQSYTLNLANAYEIQATLLGRELGKGGSLAGYKMGLTSKAKQRDVNVHDAICGFLLEDMEVKNPLKLCLDRYIHPRIEPEIIMSFKRDLEAPISVEELSAQLDFVGLAAEILDSRFEQFQFSLVDVVADNTSAAGFVRSRKSLKNHYDQLPWMGVVVSKNAEVVQTGAPAAVLGHPIASVMELLGLLKTRKTGLRAGQLVLTGGITASIPLRRGDEVLISCPYDQLSVHAV